MGTAEASTESYSLVVCILASVGLAFVAFIRAVPGLRPHGILAAIGFVLTATDVITGKHNATSLADVVPPWLTPPSPWLTPLLALPYEFCLLSPHPTSFTQTPQITCWPLACTSFYPYPFLLP